MPLTTHHSPNRRACFQTFTPSKSVKSDGHQSAVWRLGPSGQCSCFPRPTNPNVANALAITSYVASSNPPTSPTTQAPFQALDTNGACPGAGPHCHGRWAPLGAARSLPVAARRALTRRVGSSLPLQPSPRLGAPHARSEGHWRNRSTEDTTPGG